MGSFPFGGMRNFLIKKITIKRYFSAWSEYDNFFDKSVVQKILNAKVIFSLCNTEETHHFNFPYLFNVIRRNLVRKVRIFGV